MKHADEVKEKIARLENGETITASEQVNKAGDYCIILLQTGQRALLIGCPFCSSPFIVSQNILTEKPLTIEGAIRCPFAQAHIFTIKNEKIITQ